MGFVGFSVLGIAYVCRCIEPYFPLHVCSVSQNKVAAPLLYSNNAVTVDMSLSGLAR